MLAAVVGFAVGEAFLRNTVEMSQFKSIPEQTHKLTAASFTPLRPLWVPSDPHPARQVWASQVTDDSQPRGFDSQKTRNVSTVASEAQGLEGSPGKPLTWFPP